ncbi:hypothetical protein BLOT_001436, partial [Blomia tropicalis]
ATIANEPFDLTSQVDIDLNRLGSAVASSANTSRHVPKDDFQTAKIEVYTIAPDSNEATFQPDRALLQRGPLRSPIYLGNNRGSAPRPYFFNFTRLLMNRGRSSSTTPQTVRVPAIQKKYIFIDKTPSSSPQTIVNTESTTSNRRVSSNSRRKGKTLVKVKVKDGNDHLLLFDRTTTTQLPTSEHLTTLNLSSTASDAIENILRKRSDSDLLTNEPTVGIIRSSRSFAASQSTIKTTTTVAPPPTTTITLTTTTKTPNTNIPTTKLESNTVTTIQDDVMDQMTTTIVPELPDIRNKPDNPIVEIITLPTTQPTIESTTTKTTLPIDQTVTYETNASESTTITPQEMSTTTMITTQSEVKTTTIATIETDPPSSSTPTTTKTTTTITTPWMFNTPIRTFEKPKQPNRLQPTLSGTVYRQCHFDLTRLCPSLPVIGDKGRNLSPRMDNGLITCFGEGIINCNKRNGNYCRLVPIDVIEKSEEYDDDDDNGGGGNMHSDEVTHNIDNHNMGNNVNYFFCNVPLMTDHCDGLAKCELETITTTTTTTTTASSTLMNFDNVRRNEITTTNERLLNSNENEPSMDDGSNVTNEIALNHSEEPPVTTIARPLSPLKIGLISLLIAIGSIIVILVTIVAYISYQNRYEYTLEQPLHDTRVKSKQPSNNINAPAPEKSLRI